MKDNLKFAKEIKRIQYKIEEMGEKILMELNLH